MDNKEMKLARMNHLEGIQLTENTYNLAIGLTLVWGILINVLTSVFLKSYILRMNYIAVLVLYLVLSFGCMFLIYKSDNPAISFLGFTGLALGMGLLLTFFLTAYSSSTIYSAFLATGIVVVGMIMVSVIFPAFFLSIGRVLGVALIGSLVVELIGGLIFRLPLSIMDYVIVVIFAGYIGYDWARAQMYPKTLDNAIDSAADIYIDIINIFIRILSIMGDKDK